MHTNLKLSIFTLLLFAMGIFYYWLVRDTTLISSFLNLSHYKKFAIPFRIDWFPSFVHQFTFIIFTWLALEKDYLWFPLYFWFIINSLFELGQALPVSYTNELPKVLKNYFQYGTYSHTDMLALIMATLLAYMIIIYQKKGL